MLSMYNVYCVHIHHHRKNVNLLHIFEVFTSTSGVFFHQGGMSKSQKKRAAAAKKKAAATDAEISKAMDETHISNSTSGNAPHSLFSK